MSNLTDEELEFYYFQVHDNDKNSKLDGLELLQAIAHTKHDDEHFENDEHDTQVSDSVNQIADFHEDFNYIVGACLLYIWCDAVTRSVFILFCLQS